MKCIVFGGGGFIGSAVVDRLLRAGHSLRVFERPRIEPSRTFRASESVEWVTGDFLNAHDVAGALDGMDAVFHLVSTTLPKTSNDDPIYDVQTNIVSTLQMLNAMVAQGINRIVFISSGGVVYGDPVQLPIPETHPTEPRASYGITKLTIEKYLLMYRRLHGMNPTILRVANPFGERQREETAQGAVGVFLHRALRGEPIDIWGDGAITRDYIYVGDVADAFVSAVDYQGPQQIFNIGSEHGTSLNELVACLEQILGHSIQRRHHPERAFDVPISVLDISLARRELSWAPKVSLRDGLERTVAWVRQDLGL